MLVAACWEGGERTKGDLAIYPSEKTKSSWLKRR
jgi:hypothetical protein